MAFNNFDDGDTEGTNVNIVDSDNPQRKVKVTARGELSTSDSVNEVSAPIHTMVGLTSVRIDNPQLVGRASVIIQVDKNVYIGFTNTVTTTSGHSLLLRKGQIVQLDLSDQIELWAISASVGVSTRDVVVTQGRV